MRSLKFLCLLIVFIANNGTYGQLTVRTTQTAAEAANRRVEASKTEWVSGPLPIEIASGAKSFAPADIDLSPDGLWVAYTLSDPRRRKIQSRPSDQWNIFNCSGVPYVFSDSDVLITNTQT